PPYPIHYPLYSAFFLLIRPPPPRSTLFPYTTLFRSYQRTLIMEKVRAKKHLGQHFLTDENIAQKIADSLTFDGYNHILEIGPGIDRKSTRLNSSHVKISYAVFCLKKKKKKNTNISNRQQPNVGTANSQSIS